MLKIIDNPDTELKEIAETALKEMQKQYGKRYCPCGLQQCVGFSKCASTFVTKLAALMMMLLGCFEPIQAFIASIPPCVIGGGTACVLYGFISSSGIKLLKEVDLNDNKSLIICSVVLSLGISGIAIGNATFSISATALALIAGVILNLILKDKTVKN